MAAPQASELPSADTKPVSKVATTRLEIRNLSLSLDDRVILDDVGFAVAEGEAVGLLGPNGSGKSSLLRCVTGLWRADRGTVWLDGEQLDDRNRALRARMGVVFQDPSLDAELSARENILLGGRMFGLSRNEALRRGDELLEFMELSDRADERVKTLSGGMRRRLELARALVSEPSILLLDEPTTGLDLHAFERTWQRLLALRRARELAILVSTHRPDEAARCDRLVVMDRGHIIACDTPAALLSRVSGDLLELETGHPEEVAADLREHFDLAPEIEGQRLVARVEEAHAMVPRVVEAFPTGLFTSIQVRRPTLADAFFMLTGHTLEDENAES